ncbi:hypothetical protein ABVT39_003865, partial [Epinephelus coioides]
MERTVQKQRMDMDYGKKKLDKVMTETEMVAEKIPRKAAKLAEGEKTAAERNREKGKVEIAAEGRRGEMVAVVSLAATEAVESGAAGS